MRFFSLSKPAKTYTYVAQNSLLWLATNLALILLFALVYRAYDDEEVSIFNGLAGIEQRRFSDYIYLSIIINTTLGLGEIVPFKDNAPEHRERQHVSRVLVAVHIMTSLLLNDALDSFENIKLA